MRKYYELRTTNNRGVYRKHYRSVLDGYGLCSFCKPHSGCNLRKHYGGYKHKSVVYPSWKLVSKNKKQWMEKPLKVFVETENHLNLEYISFKWN